MNMRRILSLVPSEESVERLEDKVVVNTSNPTKGREWTTKVLRRRFPFRQGRTQDRA